MRSIPAFSKKMTDTQVRTSTGNAPGFTPNVMVSKAVTKKPSPGLASFKGGGSHGPKAQLGGRTPGHTTSADKGRKVHAARMPAAFSKKKI